MKHLTTILLALTLMGCAKDNPAPPLDCPNYEYLPNGNTTPKPSDQCKRVGVADIEKTSTIALFVDGTLWLQVLEGDTIYDRKEFVPIGSELVYTVEAIGYYKVYAGSNWTEQLGDSDGSLIVTE